MVDKKYYNHIKLILSFIMAFLFFSVLCFASDEFHVRSSRLDPHRSFRFSNITGDFRYIQSFPYENLMKRYFSFNSGMSLPQHSSLTYNDGAGDSISVFLYYRVFTSLSDAEEKIMEVLCGDSAVYTDAITLGKVGEIGDNCWYNDTSVWFIRNNIVVHISSTQNKDKTDQKKFINCIKYVDSLLCDSPSTNDPSIIKAPQIISVDTISDLSNENTVTIKVNASDPQNRKIFYSYLGWPWSITKESNGILKLINPKIFPAPYSYSELLIWVENEDNIVASFEYNF